MENSPSLPADHPGPAALPTLVPAPHALIGNDQRQPDGAPNGTPLSPLRLPSRALWVPNLPPTTRLLGAGCWPGEALNAIAKTSIAAPEPRDPSLHRAPRRPNPHIRDKGTAVQIVQIATS